jgi:hypothetical protein|tara:strand:- start:2 stop:325 length:324 start_codon:yes stop_codon:yes gene_type:complete
MIEIQRFSPPGTSVTITNSVSTTAKIPFENGAGGALHVAATNAVTEITWYGSPDEQTTPQKIYSGGNAVTTAITDGVHPFPDSTFGVRFLCPVASNASLTSVVTVKG